MADAGAELADIDVTSGDDFAARGYPHEAWTRLRREAPVYWYERPGVQPFWAITRLADITWISRQPRRFLNEPRLAVFPDFEDESPDPENRRLEFRHLLNMDPPEHRSYRRVVSSRFTPRAIEALRPEVERITRDILDEIAREGDLVEGEFVADVSARIPLAVLAEMLGVPRDDWELLFRWTNETIGATDPEYQHGASVIETAERSRQALFEYFVRMVEERRARPTADMVSAIANAELDGAPLPTLELLSYYFLLVVAGNETTRNAMSGGLLAVIDHPAEWGKLRRNPALLRPAVEEILRWTSPVIQFCRTAAEDVELHGETIRAGESVTLFYPSANRDEEVFEDPFAFRIDRRPNPHIAFGIGEHSCLGAHLARLELEVLFRQLADRLEHAEQTGPVRRLRSGFVGGIKAMPVRYRLRRAAA